MSSTDRRSILVSKALLASAVAPSLPCLSAYYFVEYFDITLPDHFGHQAFLTEAVLFYIGALPAFWIVYAVKKSLLIYLLVGMFSTWPLWNLLMGLPSDASVAPLNPQFFLAPTTAAFGLVSGLLFFLIVGRQEGSVRGSRPSVHEDAPTATQSRQ